MNTHTTNTKDSDCNACIKGGLNDFMAPETLCAQHKTELKAKEKKVNTSFVFSDPRFEANPDIKKQLAAETQYRLGEMLEQKEANILFLQLQKLSTIGYDVQIKKQPTPAEEMAEAVEKANEEGFKRGQRNVMRKVKEIAPAVFFVVTTVAPLVLGVFYAKGVKRGAKDLKTELVDMGIRKAARWYMRG